MKLIKPILIAIIFVAMFSSADYSQSKPNSIYFEFLGNGGFYSINYDRLFTDNLGGRIGFMYLSKLDLIIFSIDNIVIMPITINYFLGNGNNKFEIGAGIDYLSFSGGSVFGFESNTSASRILGTATIGYRYQQSLGGFLFRIGFTPIFDSKSFQPYGGLSIGYSF